MPLFAVRPIRVDDAATTSPVQDMVVRIVKIGGDRSDRHHEKWRRKLLHNRSVLEKTGELSGCVKIKFEAPPTLTECIHDKKPSWTGRGHDRAGQIICLCPNSNSRSLFNDHRSLTCFAQLQYL